MELPELLRASNFTLVCQSLKEYQHRYLKRWPLLLPHCNDIAGNQSWITHRKTDN
jgi:hypothetical protein